MRARRLDRWGGSAEPAEVPEPVPGEGEVLVRVEACGVGLTVLNCMAGDLGNSPDDLPRVPGHELVGTIVDAGPGVPRARVGERVAAYFYLFCGRCRACLAATESLCERLAGFVGVDRDGGYAELAVLGAAGGVGIHMVQVAALHGAEVLGLEATRAKVDRLRDELGIAATDSSDLAGVELPAGWELGADVVVDLVGRPETLRWAIDHLATGGRLVALTTFRDVEVPVSPRELVFRQLSLLGSRYASRREVLHAAELVAAGRVRPVVTERAGIEDVDRIHAALRSGELVGRGAVVWE